MNAAQGVICYGTDGDFLKGYLVDTTAVAHGPVTPGWESFRGEEGSSEARIQKLWYH